MCGKSAEGFPLLERAVETAASMKRRPDRALFFVNLGEGHLIMGRTKEAGSYADRAITLASDCEERGNKAYGLRLLGEIESYPNVLDIDKAEKHYRQAIEIAEELGMRPLLAHCHHELGKLNRRMRKKGESHDHSSIAIAMFREMEMDFWLQKAERENF